MRWGLSRQGRIESNEVLLPFPLALGKGKTNLFARWLVFLVYILDEFLQVGKRFFGHFRFLFVSFCRHEVDYSIGLGVKPKGRWVGIDIKGDGRHDAV
jgi:hypothetical protein